MLAYLLAVLTGYLAIASSREVMRPMPTITNSLVNLGKMEIAFYFKDSTPRMPDFSPTPAPPMFSPKIEPTAEEPCICSGLRNVKDSLLTNPTGLLNKILTNNDLFSFNKDPFSSTLCCESHEHIQEGTFIFEFPANQKPLKPTSERKSPLPMMPYLFDSVIPNKSMLPQMKTKAIEIFLFPKKKDMGNFEIPKFQPKKKDTVPKADITVVGDKKLDNIDLFKPALPPKKDLKVQEKNKKENETERPVEVEVEEKMIVEPAGKPNAV